jgi:hypothetical protein
MSFDLTKIEAIKTVTVYNNFRVAGAATYTFSLNVSSIAFDPDFVTVKSALYAPDVLLDDDGLFSIKSNTLGGHLCHVYLSPGTVDAENTYTLTANTVTCGTLPLRKPITNIDFTAVIDGAGTTASLSGSLFMTLEFVKLKVEKPQKVY